MSTKIYAYKAGSRSAKALAEALGVRILRQDTSWEGHYGDVVINWGSSRSPFRNANLTFMIEGDNYEGWLNNPSNVNVAACKLATFNKLKELGIAIPEFTTDIAIAENWQASGSIIVARSVLRGNSGEGITVVDDQRDLSTIPDIKLWVKYIKKKHEYRVHVMQGKVIDVQVKKRRRVVDDLEAYAPEPRIRNLANGYVFCREGITANSQRDELAVNAVAALGLDFGAVDLIYNQHINKYFVLEVNTAPGLEGTTLERYAKVFKEVLAGVPVTPLVLSDPEAERARLAADEAERREQEQTQYRLLVASNRALSQIQELIPILNGPARQTVIDTINNLPAT